MATEYLFPDIDTSYWRVNDKQWIADRKAQWANIEPKLGSIKTKRGISIIKQYFLRGKMPDWEKLKYWDESYRHIDLFMFLWMHPTWDIKVLTELRNQYLFEDVATLEDINRGIALFLDQAIVGARRNYSNDPERERLMGLHTDMHNELLFQVLFDDLKQQEYEVHRYDDLFEKDRTYSVKVPQSSIEHVALMGAWLSINELKPANLDFLYQYDQPLGWWINGIPKDEDYFRTAPQAQGLRDSIRKALYRIAHFDTQKEGDTCRTRFVYKMRKILDERDFIPDFKQMWVEAQVGKEIVPVD